MERRGHFIHSKTDMENCSDVTALLGSEQHFPQFRPQVTDLYEQYSKSKLAAFHSKSILGISLELGVTLLSFDESRPANMISSCGESQNSRVREGLEESLEL